MKLPFLNRHRYIVVKAYTQSKTIAEKAPITLSGKANREFLRQKPKKDRLDPDFRSCFGHIAAQRSSFVLHSWSEMMLFHDDKGLHLKFPAGNNYTTVQFVDDNGFQPVGMKIVKHEVPWLCECSHPDVPFVMARSIFNTTPMCIPSGVTSIGMNPTLNFFQHVFPNEEYMIPFNAPLLQMYPQSDLPVKVEAYHDMVKFSEIATATQSRTHFSSTLFRQYRNVLQKR